MIDIKDIVKKFSKTKALDGISLSFNQGDCIALIGPNGCGKTTLMKSILGMVIPDKGIIEFNGKTIIRQFKYREHIGYMPQIGRYPENMTVKHLIETIKEIRKYNRPIDEDLFEAFHINKIADKKMRALSGGTIQKVSATIAFMFAPDALILDEPTAGLDPIASEILKEKIIKQMSHRKLVLISSHLLSELDKLVNRVVFMQEGRVRFSKTIESLKAETKRDSISEAITHILKETADKSDKKVWAE